MRLQQLPFLVIECLVFIFITNLLMNFCSIVLLITLSLVFGCQCFPWLKPYTSHKLQPISIPSVILGYHPAVKGYRCLDPQTGKVLLLLLLVSVSSLPRHYASINKFNISTLSSIPAVSSTSSASCHFFSPCRAFLLIFLSPFYLQFCLSHLLIICILGLRVLYLLLFLYVLAPFLSLLILLRLNPHQSRKLLVPLFGLLLWGTNILHSKSRVTGHWFLFLLINMLLAASEYLSLSKILMVLLPDIKFDWLLKATCKRRVLTFMRLLVLFLNNQP